MWKDEKPLIPYNAMAHVAIDNVDFVSGLRRTDSIGTQMRKYKEQKLTSDAQTQENKLTKPTNCIFQSCLAVGPLISETLQERVELMTRIQAAAFELGQQQEYFDIIDKESQKASQVLLGLNTKAEALAEKETVDLRRQMAVIISQRRQIEAKLRGANKHLKTLRKQKEKQQNHQQSSALSVISGFDRDPNKLYFEHFEDNKKKKTTEKKHNGIFTMTEHGYKAWSCCYCEDEHMPGCIDDHSVDILQTLGDMKRNTHNYIDYPLHPLVPMSSVVLTGNNTMVEKLYSETHMGKQQTYLSRSVNSSYVSPSVGHQQASYMSTLSRPRPMTAGPSVTIGNHESISSHFSSMQIRERQQRTSRNNSPIHGVNDSFVSNAFMHTSHSDNRHNKQPLRARSPQISNQLSTMSNAMHYNSLPNSPLASPKGGRATSSAGGSGNRFAAQQSASMWHTTSSVEHSSPVRAHNQISHPITATITATAAATRTTLTAAAPASSGNIRPSSAAMVSRPIKHPKSLRIEDNNHQQEVTGKVHLHTRKNNFIGKVREDPSRPITNMNRPMSSPGGFALYMK